MSQYPTRRAWLSAKSPLIVGWTVTVVGAGLLIWFTSR